MKCSVASYITVYSLSSTSLVYWGINPPDMNY